MCPARSDRRSPDVVALLGTLAERLASARSPAAVGPALVETLAGHMPLVALSLLYGGSGGDFHHGQPPALPPLVVALPPARTGDPPGELRLWLARASDREALAGSGLVALGQIVGAALATARVLSRLAVVSKRAHDANRELRAGHSPEAAVAVAASAAMRTLLWETVPLVARQDTTVLLRGESGTGKELIARAIHTLSPRAARPLVTINCGALPEALVESQLFGHERGAFTGADRRRPGVFERAHGGTVFLDEVGDLPPGAQVKLLRVLQDGDYERVGGATTLHADVRVVAATHRPLETMVADGRFRADLYYRLDVFPIVIPPLRERPDDLPVLATALLARLAARHGRRPPLLTAAALAQLRTHSFPGNVRELENVLERALILSPGDELRLPFVFSAPLSGATPASAPSSLQDTMTAAVVEALRRSGGRIHGPGGAAERPGLPPTTLQSKIRRLGLQRRDFQP